MASTTSFKTVTIAGATGTVGFSVAEAFLNEGSYKIKILRKKPESKNEKADLLASKGAEIVYVNYNEKDDLVKAFKGTDVIVSFVNSYDMKDNYYSIQAPMVEAAKEAGVKRFIPSEFGGDYAPNTHVFIDSKYQVRKLLEESGLEYTFIYTGLISEFIGWFGFDVKTKIATFYVDGDKKLATTSTQDLAKFTVESLKLPEARNGVIRVASSVLSFNEILQKFEEVTGSKWEKVEDKEVRHRFSNKIEPIPTILDDFKVVACLHSDFEKLDNDKFSFTPTPITEQIKVLANA